jgi:hypothetical protein
MCFSATISYAAAAVLVPTGFYAATLARRLPQPWWVMAVTPVFFGIQQACEARVWQLLGAGEPAGALPFALGFHFFSHFLWLWWIPLASYLIEPGARRRRLFAGVALFGFLAGGLVYANLLLHPEWLSVQVEGRTLVYTISSPVRGPVHLPFPASVLYGLIILVPLLGSSLRSIRIFGWLVALSIVAASVAWGYAFVSVWCFFAAALSVYFVLVIRQRLTRQDGAIEATS